MFHGLKVLVAGGTGLVGTQLTRLLIEEEGAKVSVVSLDLPSRVHPGAHFHRLDLMDYKNCSRICADMDYVFNLLCVKGSPKAVKEYPATYFDVNLILAVNLLRAARTSGAKGYLFTSTGGVYAPCEVAQEDMVWKTFPSENDKFAGWAKRMGELQTEAYRLQYQWNEINIVRPANIYGPHDNFGAPNAMVITSLITRACSGENPLVIWGDGNSERDFIHAEDVARGMILVTKRNPGYPVNLGSGKGTSIKELTEIIVSNLNRRPEIVWDTSKPAGDRKRILDISRAKALGFQPGISLEEGIRMTMRWYRENRDKIIGVYDVFG